MSQSPQKPLSVQQYTVMVSFSTASISVADDVRAELYHQFTEMLEEYADLEYGNVQMVRGDRVTRADVEESNALADEADAFSNDGFNHAPLPEDFPKL